MIGIAGPSCSGKTELARYLEQEIGAIRIPLDAYYRDLAGLAPALREGSNFDHPDALDSRLLIDQLRSLSAGRSIEMPLYDFRTHRRRPNRRSVTPGRCVVVEGLFALYFPDVRDLLALSVYLDLEEEQGLQRRLRRDTRQRGRDEASVREQYERTVAPMYRRFVEPTRSHADLLLRGDRPVAELGARVAWTVIRKNLHRGRGLR